MVKEILSRFGYEKRDGYTDIITAAIMNQATGATASHAATSALESAAGIVGRAFASAKVNGKRADVLTPQIMMMLGRDLIKRGQSVFMIQADPLQLVPVGAFSIVSGTYDPHTWRYELTLDGPSKSSVHKVQADDVVHVRINVDASKPWAGCSPADSASLASGLATNVSQALADEANGPRGSFLPLPGGDSSELATAAKNAGGRMLLVESTSDAWETGGTPPKGDYEQRRYGANPPESLVRLLETSNNQTLAAIGISGALFSATDAASAMAAYRMLANSLIAPLGRLAQAELRTKLDDEDLALDFGSLMHSDVAQRAAALKRLVESGTELERALALSGLLAQDAA